MQVNNKIIVVTGGGGGIGRELVLNLVKKGATVAAVDLNENALKETVELAGSHKNKISTHVINVSDKDAVDALPQVVIDTHGSVDAIINNAGIIQPFVRLAELEMSVIERVLNVNLYGVIYMTKAFLPHLLERPEAHVVNVSSMAGFFPFPGQTLYGASKAAVKLLTEGLYSELLETNIGVTVVFPGAIATDITKNSGVESKTSPEDDGNSNIPMTSAQDTAEIIIKSMEKNKLQVYIGNDAKMMNLFYKFFPRRAIHFVQGQMKGMLE